MWPPGAMCHRSLAGDALTTQSISRGSGLLRSRAPDHGCARPAWLRV